MLELKLQESLFSHFNVRLRNRGLKGLNFKEHSDVDTYFLKFSSSLRKLVGGGGVKYGRYF